MKIAIVYTGTTPELSQTVEENIARRMDGLSYEIASYVNPDILQEVRDNGGVTPGCARRLVGQFWLAAQEGADIILSACSSVGEVNKLAQPLFAKMGISLVRIDEDMAMDAARNAKRIAVAATLPTTLGPTKQLILDCAAKLGKEVELVDALAKDAFGLSPEQFKQKLIETGREVIDKADALLFAQGSMAYAEEAVSQALKIPVYSSVRYGAAAVRAAADAISNAPPKGGKQ